MPLPHKKVSTPGPLPTPISSPVVQKTPQENMMDWLGTVTNPSLQADLENPNRYISFKDIPGAEEVAKRVATLIHGPNTPPVMPENVGIFGGKYPTNIGGVTTPDNQISLSAANVMAFLNGDYRTKPERAGFPGDDKLNPNINSDPTTNVTNTLAHELTHLYQQTHGFEKTSLADWRTKNSPVGFIANLKAMFSPNPYPPKPIDDLDRIEALRNNFSSPFWNSHAWQSDNLQAAPVIGHQIGGDWIGVKP